MEGSSVAASAPWATRARHTSRRGQQRPSPTVFTLDTFYAGALSCVVTSLRLTETDDMRPHASACELLPPPPDGPAQAA